VVEKMSKEITTIEEGFDSYKRDVIPETAGALQVSECKRSFYAGAGLMFGRMMALSELPAQQAEDGMTALFSEVQFFVECEMGKTTTPPGTKQ
jgi:hypothetical protein